MKLCNFKIGLDQPLFLIAGPCVIESEQLVIGYGGSYLKEITEALEFLLFINHLLIKPIVLHMKVFVA